MLQEIVTQENASVALSQLQVNIVQALTRPLFFILGASKRRKRLHTTSYCHLE